MPAAPRPRRWFQLHLTTCIVVMLAAAILVWLNTRTRWICFSSIYRKHVIMNTARVEFTWGWPVVMNRVFEANSVVLVTEIPTEVLEDMIERQDFSACPEDADTLKELTARPQPFSGRWVPINAAFNALTALAILLITACVVEISLRRWETRNRQT